jgi:hypothetical protein
MVYPSTNMDKPPSSAVRAADASRNPLALLRDATDNLPTNARDPILGRRLFVDGIVRPVFADNSGAQ